MARNARTRNARTRNAATAAQAAQAQGRQYAVWTREEELQLLHAWRDALRDSGLASSDGHLHVDTRTYLKLVDAGSNFGRSEKSVTCKKHILLCVYRVIAQYNETQRQKHTIAAAAAAADANEKDVQKKQVRKKRKTPNKNYWFALSAAEKQSIYAARYGNKRYLEVDREMFALLAEIEKRRQGNTNSNHPRVVSHWTLGELWLLITAWRQVVEGHPDARDQNVMIYERFHVLSKERNAAMPRRSNASLVIKRRRIMSMHKVISEYNQQGPIGPHGVGARDWFSLSADEKSHYMSVSKLDDRFSNISRDVYNAVDIIMRHEEASEKASSNRDGDQAPSAAFDAIDVVSDSDIGSDSDSSGWEMLSEDPSSVQATALPTNFRSGSSSTADRSPRQAPMQSEGWSRFYETSARKKSEPEYRALAPNSRNQSAVSSTDSSDDDESQSGFERGSRDFQRQTPKSRETKQKQSPELVTIKQAQELRDVLRAVRNERKRGRREGEAMLEQVQDERRRVRKERKRVEKMIARDQEDRQKERENRERERQEWEVEKEKLRHKLSTMRERYKKAMAKLKRRPS